MKKYIVSAFLVVVLFVSSVVPVRAATGEVISVATFVVEIIDRWYSSSTSSAQKEADLAGYKKMWISSIDSSLGVVKISYESLSDLCVQMNQAGQPCKMVYSSTLGGYVIRASGPFGYARVSNSSGFGSTYIWNNVNYYFTTANSQYYLSPYNSDSLLSSITGYIDQVEGRLARTVDGVVYGVGDSAYHTWKTLESMSGTVERIASRMLMYSADGEAHTVAESAYWGYQYQKYAYSRLSDVITAIENIGVASVTLDGVQLNVDSSNINFWNNHSYCCGYRTDADGNPYDTFTIPYDAATAIVARLNTDYVGQSITSLNRNGTTSQRVVRSARIHESGVIELKLTNGYTYLLCDNVNTIYVVDENTNYGSRIDNTLNNVISRLDTIIENQQNSFGLTTCDHQYVSEVSQEPDCTLPGLMVYTCELCEASYSEIMDPLGHDWLCTDHVEAVTDENGEVLESSYDIYTCQRCNQIYYDYDGTGAPDPGHGSTVTDLITAVFTKLGNFVGGLVSAVINLLDKLLTGFDSIVSDFNDRTNQIVNFGGAYPAWLGGIWEIIPADLQLALGFCVVCLALGIIGKKVVFS